MSPNLAFFNVHHTFKLMFVSFTSQHATNPMRFNAVPMSPALANIHSTLGSALCWLGATHLQSLTMNRIHGTNVSSMFGQRRRQ